MHRRPGAGDRRAVRAHPSVQGAVRRMSKLSVTDCGVEAVLITSWISPLSMASTQCGRPSSTLFDRLSPPARPREMRDGGAAGGGDLVKPISVRRRAI